MNAKGIIKKFLFITMWIAIGGGMLVLLIAAMGQQRREHCRDYEIVIRGGGPALFLNEKDIEAMLTAAAVGKVRGQKKSTLNLLQIEAQLEKNKWIRDAELYFDSQDILHVSIREREPLARVFTGSGKSFYIDEEETRIPLSARVSARVPVFTGFPEKILSRRDSLLVSQVRSIAAFVQRSKFWMAQVAQIDITPDRNFEMVPVVGNHLVQLGDGENFVAKFHRLFVFYSNVLSQVGFEKYRMVNVQYAGQVIGVRNEGEARVDTAQLRLNVEKLLREARELQNDSLAARRLINQQRMIRTDPAMSATENTTNQP